MTVSSQTDEIFDFVIIGAGIAGASVAAYLAEDATLCLLEGESQAGYHATGRSAAMYVPAYGPPAIRMLTRASGAFFKTPPIGFADTALLRDRAILMIATSAQRQSLLEFEQDVEAAQIMQKLDASQLHQYQPLLRDGYADSGLYDPTGSDIDVDALHRGFLRQTKQHGGHIVTNSRVTSLIRKNAVWHVQTNTGQIKGRVIINAAGAWAEAVGEMAGAETIGLVPKRRTALLIKPDDTIELASMPMTIDVDEQFYLKPDAGLLLLSPANEDPMPACDVQPDELDIAICIDRIEQAFGLSISRLNAKWAGLRSFVSDKVPVVGYSNKIEGFFWLAGQGGYGIQTSPALGRFAAAAARGEQMPEDIAKTGLTAEMLHPDRLR